MYLLANQRKGNTKITLYFILSDTCGTKNQNQKTYKIRTEIF